MMLCLARLCVGTYGSCELSQLARTRCKSLIVISNLQKLQAPSVPTTDRAVYIRRTQNEDSSKVCSTVSSEAAVLACFTN